MIKYAFSLALLVSVISIQPAMATPAPGFSLPTSTGSVKLSELKGKLVYLDFWASWCVPCRKSFPWMNEMQARYADKGLVIIAVNLDKERKFVKKFLETYPAKFTIAYDPEGNTASAYKVTGMPSSYLIDPKGDLQYSHIGFREQSKPELEKQINELLRKR